MKLKFFITIFYMSWKSFLSFFIFSFYKNMSYCKKCKPLQFLSMVIFLYLHVNLFATIRYVSHDTNYTGGGPYTTPSTAATNIQLAYNVCSAGDTIIIIDNYVTYSPILLNTTSNITIKADTDFSPAIRIPSGSAGIDINSINNIRILGLTLIGITNQTTALSLYSVNHSTLSNCTIISNDVGIYIGTGTSTSVSNRIRDCFFQYYTIGIDLYENTLHTWIYNNKLIWGKEKGIWLHRNSARRPEYNAIINNTFMSNGTYNNTSSYPAGIYITETHYNIIQKNLFLFNGNGVIFDGACTSNQVLNNTFYKNTRFIMGSSLHHSGIEFYSCNDTSNEIKGNISVGNNYGFYADATANQTITYNLAYNNTTTCNGYINNGNFTSGDGCIINDPAFKNITITNFNLKFSSSAIRTSFSNTIEQASIGKYTISLEPLSDKTNVITTNIIRFTTDKINGYIPGDGKIKIVYPTGFGISGITGSDISSTTMNGTFLSSVSGQTLTITRSGGTDTTGGETEAITIKNVTNINFTSSTNYIQLSILNSANQTITEYEDSNDFFVGVPLLLLISSPSSNQHNFPTTDNLILTFNAEIKNLYLSTNYIYIFDEEDNKLSISFSKQNQTNVILNPNSNLLPNHYYELHLAVNITATNGGALHSDITIPFYSSGSIETIHTYNTITCDGNGSDWIKTNNVHYLNNKTEMLTNDISDNTPTDEAITNLWATWDSTNIYIRLDKNNDATGFSANTFQDYIFLDITHDTKGATTSTYDGHTITFPNTQKPDFRIYVYDQWSGGYSAGLTCEKWDGTTWVNAGTSSITWQGTGTPPYNFILEVGIRADFLTNNSVSATNTSPNRISILSYSKWTANSTATDFCPENQKFIDITPDNNNDGILDEAGASAILTITKSVSNIMLSSFPTTPIPGAYITYKISYSNSGPIDATNVIINDHLPLNVSYISNSTKTNSAPPTWKIEFSTNTAPSQDFESTAYSTSETNYKKIKWIRFKKDKVLINETGTFYYSVMIK